jgi:hypothetical protein
MRRHKWQQCCQTGSTQKYGYKPRHHYVSGLYGVKTIKSKFTSREGSLYVKVYIYNIYIFYYVYLLELTTARLITVIRSAASLQPVSIQTGSLL